MSVCTYNGNEFPFAILNVFARLQVLIDLLLLGDGPSNRGSERTQHLFGESRQSRKIQGAVPSDNAHVADYA